MLPDVIKESVHRGFPRTDRHFRVAEEPNLQGLQPSCPIISWQAWIATLLPWAGTSTLKLAVPKHAFRESDLILLQRLTRISLPPSPSPAYNMRIALPNSVEAKLPVEAFCKDLSRSRNFGRLWREAVKAISALKAMQLQSATCFSSVEARAVPTGAQPPAATSEVTGQQVTFSIPKQAAV